MNSPTFDTGAFFLLDRFGLSRERLALRGARSEVDGNVGLSGRRSTLVWSIVELSELLVRFTLDCDGLLFFVVDVDAKEGRGGKRSRLAWSVDDSSVLEVVLVSDFDGFLSLLFCSAELFFEETLEDLLERLLKKFMVIQLSY